MSDMAYGSKYSTEIGTTAPLSSTPMPRGKLAVLAGTVVARVTSGELAPCGLAMGG